MTQPLSWTQVLAFIHQTNSKKALLRDGLRYLKRLARRSRNRGIADATVPSEAYFPNSEKT